MNVPPVIGWFLLTSAVFAQNRASMLPPQPEPVPPKFAPAPPRDTSRITPLNEEIPDWQARWELARALSYLKRYDESLSEYRKVLAVQSGNLAVRQDYGQVLLWAGRIDEAYAELNAVPSADLTRDAAIAFADTLVARREFNRAEPLYRAQLQADPNDQLTRLKLAELLSWGKRYDESLPLYRIILAARPNDTQVRRRFALVLLWSGHPEESANEMRKTLAP